MMHNIPFSQIFSNAIIKIGDDVFKFIGHDKLILTANETRKEVQEGNFRIELQGSNSVNLYTSIPINGKHHHEIILGIVVGEDESVFPINF